MKPRRNPTPKKGKTTRTSQGKQFRGKPHTIVGSLIKKAKQSNEIQATKSKYHDSQISRAIIDSLKRDHKEYFAQFDSKFLAENSKNKSEYEALKEIQNEQELEYQIALNEELERKAKERKEEEERIMKINKEKEDALNKLKAMQEQFNRMKEPETGIAVAVVLPNQERITRKFDENQFGKEIYTWVGVQKVMIKDDIYPIPFSVVMPLGEVLDREETLEKQGLKRRVLLKAMID